MRARIAGCSARRKAGRCLRVRRVISTTAVFGVVACAEGSLWQLPYVIITSVDRNDLRDVGAADFAACIQKPRQLSPHTQIEISVPDFQVSINKLLDFFNASSCDVMNHNVGALLGLHLKR